MCIVSEVTALEQDSNVHIFIIILLLLLYDERQNVPCAIYVNILHYTSSSSSSSSVEPANWNYDQRFP